MFYSRADIIKGMNENLFELFGDVFVTDFSITGDDYKKSLIWVNMGSLKHIHYFQESF